MNNVQTPHTPVVVPYHHQDFPMMLHHQSGATRTVKDDAERKRVLALAGWSDTPTYPKYYYQANGAQQVVKNSAEEEQLLTGPQAKFWLLHPCSEREEQPEEATRRVVK
jgi:hypothetical protein